MNLNMLKAVHAAGGGRRQAERSLGNERDVEKVGVFKGVPVRFEARSKNQKFRFTFITRHNNNDDKNNNNKFNTSNVHTSTTT